MTRLESRLAALAAAGQTITYGTLARELGLRIGELTAALEATMETDAKAGNPLRATVCAGKLNHGLPALGFFEKAAILGYDTTQQSDFVTEHRRRLQLSPQ